MLMYNYTISNFTTVWEEIIIVTYVAMYIGVILCVRTSLKA